MAPQCATGAVLRRRRREGRVEHLHALQRDDAALDLTLCSPSLPLAALGERRLEVVPILQQSAGV